LEKGEVTKKKKGGTGSPPGDRAEKEKNFDKQKEGSFSNWGKKIAYAISPKSKTGKNPTKWREKKNRMVRWVGRVGPPLSFDA